MRTEQIISDETTTEVVEETEEVDGYAQPVITISKTTIIGDVTDTVRIELQESSIMDSPGAVVHLVEVALRTLQEEPVKKPPQQRVELGFQLRPVSAEKLKTLLDGMESRLPGADETWVEVEVTDDGGDGEEGVVLVPGSAGASLVDRREGAYVQTTLQGVIGYVQVPRFVDAEPGDVLRARFWPRDIAAAAPAGGVEDLADAARAGLGADGGSN